MSINDTSRAGPLTAADLAEACSDAGAEAGELEPAPSALAALVGPLLVVLVIAAISIVAAFVRH